jgi:hypothetical protein
VEARPAGRDLDVALLGAQLERHVAGRQAADDVGKQPSGEQDRSLALDLGRVDAGGERQLHVGGAQRQASVVGDREHAAERRQRAAGRDGAPDQLEGGREGITWYGKLHRESLIFLTRSDVFVSWIVWDKVGIGLDGAV